MATWRVNNSTALGGEVCSPWQANHAYSLGARCVASLSASDASRAKVFECTTSGTSHAATEPTWNTTVGNTTSDGGVTWTCRSPSDGDWDNASCYINYITRYALSAVGDTVLVHKEHSEDFNYALAVIISQYDHADHADPAKYYCVDKDDSDSLATGAVIKDSPYALYFQRNTISYGITYNFAYNDGGTSGGARAKIAGSGLGNLLLEIRSGGLFAFSGSSTFEVSNGDIKFNALNSYIGMGYNSSGKFIWNNGVLVAPNGVTAVFKTLESHLKYIRVSDVDLSAVGAGATATSLVGLASGLWDVVFTRCKLPDDAGFTITSGTWAESRTGKIVLHHCSASNKYYDLYESSYEGVTEDETTNVRTGGASDGTTRFSYKMVSSGNTVDNINGLVSPDIHAWTSSTTEKTFTIEGIWDSATNIQDDEIWMELEYPADNSSGLGAIAKDKCAILGTPADQTASTETWTTTGLTNPNKFKLSVTVTPGKAGPITARVYLAKASTTVYIDPLITES